MRHRSSLFVALLSAALLVACGGDGGPNGSGGNVILETIRAVSDSIGPAGGSLSATGSNGTSYTVTFPAGAVKDPTLITMTPLADIKDLEVSTLAGGVEFQPSGLVLATPAILTIGNGGVPAIGEIAIGFNADDEADSVAVDLAAESGGDFTVLVRHFSLSGFAFATVGQIQALTPQTGGNSQSQFFVNSLLQLVAQSPRNFLAEENAMRAWFTNVILPGVQNASSDVQLLLAVAEYNFWRQVTTPSHLIADDPLFATERSDFAQTALAKLQQAVTDNNAQCRANRSLGFANNVLFWQTVAEDLGVASGANSLDRATVLAGLCIKVFISDSSFPDPATPGLAANYDLLSGIRFDSSTALLTATFSYAVDVSGSTNDGVRQSLSDANGSFFTAITPSGTGPLLLLTSSCLFVPEVPYADVCTSFLLTRNFGGCSTVFQGTATVNSPTSLAGLTGVSEITGTLNIQGGVGVVDLPCLTKVHGSINITGGGFFPWASPGITNLANLDSIGGSLTVFAPGLFDLQLPALTSVVDIAIGGNTDLQIVSLPGIVARDVNINQNTGITSIAIGKSTMRTLRVRDNPFLASMAVDSLAAPPGSGGLNFDIVRNLALTTLTLGSLNGDSTGFMMLVGNSALGSLAGIPSSTTMGNFSFDLTNGFNEAAALAFANRITVLQVCQRLNEAQVSFCYTGPPWH